MKTRRCVDSSIESSAQGREMRGNNPDGLPSGASLAQNPVQEWAAQNRASRTKQAAAAIYGRDRPLRTFTRCLIVARARLVAWRNLWVYFC